MSLSCLNQIQEPLRKVLSKNYRGRKGGFVTCCEGMNQKHFFFFTYNKVTLICRQYKFTHQVCAKLYSSAGW